MPASFIALVDNNTSPAASGWRLSKFQKTSENAAFDSFGSNFRGVAFCLPHRLAGFLLVIIWMPLGTKRVKLQGTKN